MDYWRNMWMVLLAFPSIWTAREYSMVFPTSLPKYSMQREWLKIDTVFHHYPHVRWHEWKTERVFLPYSHVRWYWLKTDRVFRQCSHTGGTCGIPTEYSSGGIAYSHWRSIQAAGIKDIPESEIIEELLWAYSAGGPRENTVEKPHRYSHDDFRGGKLRKYCRKTQGKPSRYSTGGSCWIQNFWFRNRDSKSIQIQIQSPIKWQIRAQARCSIHWMMI